MEEDIAVFTGDDDKLIQVDTEREEDQALGRERHSLHDIFH